MKLVLFDLDGTLLTAGGMGRRATRIALEAVFGNSGNLDVYYPGGRTQEAIFLDTLLDAGFSREEFLASKTELYRIFLDEFQKSVEGTASRIQPLPGAVKLVQALNQEADVMLGVVTGNHRENASIKLSSAGFSAEWFRVGAYGEETEVRSQLIPLAQMRAQERSGEDFSGDKTVVVGDTTRDVISARENGALSVAVTTGTDHRALLESSGPDHILDGLDDLQEVLEIILSTKHARGGE
ncbi:MAG: HAD family hydrolase [Anaerolineales bacterium]